MQIYKGLSSDNKKLNNYHSVSGVTNSKGEITLFFDDLKGNFITF